MPPQYKSLKERAGQTPQGQTTYTPLRDRVASFGGKVLDLFSSHHVADTTTPSSKPSPVVTPVITTKATITNTIPKPPTISPDILGKTLSNLESSGGTNRSSADPGEKKWLVGLTDVALKELRRVGRLPKNFNVNNEKDVINAGVSYFQLMQERNPTLSPGEVYTDKYWTQWKYLPNAQEIRRRKIDEFHQSTSTK